MNFLCSALSKYKSISTIQQSLVTTLLTLAVVSGRCCTLYDKLATVSQSDREQRKSEAGSSTLSPQAATQLIIQI